ncbi:MAG: hypothetical protein ACI9S8_000646 [Chlamydiales bacterium]|jgi:hypothetical protein
MKYLLFFLSLSLQIGFLAYTCPLPSSQILEQQTIRFFPVHIMETDDCMVSFIEDDCGNKFVLKQIKDPSPEEQFLLVLDAFACSIANQHQIPMNQLTLIPPNKDFPGKYYSDRPASLHTIAPGMAAVEESPWPSFNIHQKFRRENSRMYAKWGPLPQELMGLTPDVIHHMSLHPTLPKIVALDTFVGNADRSNPNIFYESVTHSFCGIDMAASFNSPLPEIAYSQLEKLFDKANPLLSKSKLDALKSYMAMLDSLTKIWTVEKLHLTLDHFAQLAGFEEGSLLMNQDVKNRISYHKKVMEENYISSCRLVNLLSIID